MNDIVIVEDRLGRAISLAQQFLDFSKQHPEYQVQVVDICYFCANPEIAKENIDMAKKKGCSLNIRPVNLLNFSEIMDEYMESKEKHAYLIMDYLLADDGSCGVPMQRVNIRYARNKQRYSTNKLWFYTATGTKNQLALSQLVGQEHILDVWEVDDNYLRLDLTNTDFIRTLKESLIVEA